MKHHILALSFAVLLAVPLHEAHAQLQPQPSVDPFTGAFQCAIPVMTVPGPHGSSYTITLNYSSDVRAEEEASWVGYGWTLEAPAVYRMRKGLPDDMKERTVLYHDKGTINMSSLSLRGGGEILSFNSSFVSSFGLGGTFMVSCNSMTGFDAVTGIAPNVGISLPNGLNLGIGLSYDTKGRFGLGMGMGQKSRTGGPSTSIFGISMFSYDPQSRQSPNAGMQRPFSGKNDISELSFRLGFYEAAGTFTTSTITFVDQTKTANGYLYVPDAMTPGRPDIMMDYLVEREHNVSRDDPSTLPIPLPANDEFLVSAPGFGGKFRAHHALPLGLRPSVQTSSIDVRSFSIKGVAGVNYGAGLGGIVPFPATHTMQTSGLGTEWNLNGETAEWLAQRRMQPFFRYVDDPADEVRYSSTDGSLVPGFDGLSKSAYHPVNRGRLPRMNRSVEYRTAGDLRNLYGIATGNNILRRSIEARFRGTNYTIESMPPEVIMDFTVTNEDGSMIDFNTALYSFNEKSTTYTKLDRGLNVLRPATRVFYSATPYKEENASDVSTREMSHPYVHTWYATAMYSPDYVDVNDNGPDDADAGGWTTFGYTDRMTRRWRSPYNGYWIDRQDVDDNVDDVLSFATGRQQQTFLTRVETATHVAYFYTNKDIPPTSGPVKRLDGYEPAADGSEANVPSPRPMVNDVPYLSQIVLYKKNGANPPIKLQTVHFSYDYSVAPGNPSSASYGGTHVGKLTLRRIWTEGRDVKESSIAPVDFYYNYPTAGTGAGTTTKDEINVGPLTARYGASVSFPSPVTENPTFNANNVDAWGYQTGIRPADDPGNPVMEMQRFAPPQYWQTAGDPGTYRLKTIKMPTGNRIVPIYERRTYAWVQDKPAMSLVPLTQYAGDISRRNKTGPSAQENAFTVAVQQVGLDPADATGIDRYVANLKSRFVDNGEPMYFRFAYDRNLCDDATQPLDQFYVRGYGKVMSCSLVTVTGGQKAIRLTIGAMDDSNFGTSSMSTLQEAQYNSPYGVVIKYWKTFLQGKCQCDDGDAYDPMGLMIKFGLLPGWMFNQIVSIPTSSLARIVPIRSVLKLPLAGVKAGGGARVARLLTISPDGTQEAGDASALGTEYIYGDRIGTVEKESWGVATNEPDIMREENAVVGIDPEYWHRAANEILDDALLAKMEGPIGYSLLPGASVGYSKIVMRPLNRQVNTAGYAIMKYATVRDVPTVAATKTTASVLPNDYHPLSVPMFQRSKMDVGIRQGFAIKLRQHHGLLLSSERYSGVHESAETQRLVSSTQYDYTMPGDLVDYFNTEDHTLRARAGLDHQDLMTESRLFTEKLDMFRGDFTIEINPAAPIFPLTGLGFLYNGVNHSLKTYVATNIQRQTPVVRRTISMVDGRRDTSEIMAYDIRTGLPAITRRTDSYQGTSATGSVPAGNHNSSITSVTMPALSIYPDVGQRAELYRQVFKSSSNHPVYGVVTADVVSPTALKLTRSAGTINDGRTDSLMNLFRIGDEFAIYQGTTLQAIVASTGIPVLATGSITIPVRAKVGTLATTTNVEVAVLRSGRKNFITAQAASTAYYGLDLTPAVTRSRALYGLERNLNAFNDFVRDGSGAVSRTYVNYLRFDNGSASFDVTAPYRDDIDPCYPVSFPGILPLSKFWFGTMLNPAQTQVDIGITKPYDAARNEPSCDGVHDKNFNVCSYPWTNRTFCSNDVWANVAQNPPPAVAAPGGTRCFDTHSWDLWRLFRVGDQGTLTINTFAVPPTAPNAGNVRLVGGDLPALPLIPAGARVLSAQTLSWQGFPVAISSVTYGQQWLPVTRWTWNAASPLDASGAVSGTPAVTVFQNAGTFARPTPATTAMWYDPASVTTIAPTTDGWHRGTLITKVNMHGQPTMAEDKFAVASIMQHDAPGRVVQATFADAIAGKAWYESMEDVTSGTTTVAAFTGLKSLAIASGGSATVNRPANAVAGTVSGTADIVIRMWVRPQTLASSPPSVTSITVNGSALTANDVLGTVDGWMLVETKRTETNMNTSVTIAPSSYAVFVDDVIVHSPTAVTSAMVTDVELRPVAVFGDDHYPSTMSYDARGAAAGLVNYSTNGRAVSLTGGGNVPKQVRTSLFMSGGANPDFLFKELP